MSLKWKMKQSLCVKHQSCAGSHMFRINLRGAGCKDIWFGSRVGHFSMLVNIVLFWTLMLWTSNELHILLLTLYHFNKIYHRYFLTIWNLQCASIKSQNLFLSFFRAYLHAPLLSPAEGRLSTALVTLRFPQARGENLTPHRELHTGCINILAQRAFKF